MLNTDDRWRELEEFPDYRVDAVGNMESRKRGRWKPLKQTMRNGYLKVNLCKDGKVYTRNVNNLVGDAFIGRAPGQIYNHDNGIKTDNRVENLIPTTQSGNSIHAFRTGLRTPNYDHPNRKRVMIVETGEIFESERACARATNIPQSNIYKCLKNPHYTRNGYHFRHVD